MSYIDFKKYITPIIGVSYEIDDEKEYSEFIIIGDDYKFKFKAIGDCCSTSLFQQFQDDTLESLIGKTIKSIKEIEIPDDYEEENLSNSNTYLKTHLYEIRFTNDKYKTFKFILNNYSNGYYDGWIDSSIII